MGNAAAKASAQALAASQLAGMSAQAARNAVAQYGPLAALTVTACRQIGKLPTKHVGS